MQIKTFILCFLYQKSPTLIKTIILTLFHSEVKWVLPLVEIEVNTYYWALLTSPNRIHDLHLILEMASLLIELYMMYTTDYILYNWVCDE